MKKGCGTKKMAKGGLMISPRKAMAMGKKPSGSKTKVKKFAAGGMVGGAPIPPGTAMPNRNTLGDLRRDFRIPLSDSPPNIQDFDLHAPITPRANPRISGPLPGANPRTPGPLPGANPRVVGGPKPVIDVLPGIPGGPLKRNNTRFGQGTGRPVGVRGPIMFSKGGAVKKGK